MLWKKFNFRTFNALIWKSLTFFRTSVHLWWTDFINRPEKSVHPSIFMDGPSNPSIKKNPSKKSVQSVHFRTSVHAPTPAIFTNFSIFWSMFNCDFWNANLGYLETFLRGMLEAKLAQNNLNFKCSFMFFFGQSTIWTKNRGGRISPPP